MGFNSYRSQPQVLPSPAKLYREWKGGTGALTFSVKKEDGSYENVETQLPFKMAVLETTSDLNKTTFKSGRDGKRIPDKSYFSTEKIQYDDPQILRQAEYIDGERKVSEVIRGSYETIKDNFDTSGMFRVILYIWNFDTEQIERIHLKGAGRGGWFTFQKSLKETKQSVFNAPVFMTKNPEAKKSPMGDYYEPSFVLGPEYTDEEVALLKEKDDEVIEYLQTLHEKNMFEYNGYTKDDGVDHSTSQEPRQWEGEGSQERSQHYGDPVPAEGDEQINMDDIPF